MPFRDTPRERKFAERSIPSAVSINPDELVIGVDAPADASLVRFIRDICDDRSFENVRIIQVERSPEWRFQLANTIWHCYLACTNDTILAFDVDSMLRPAVLAGLDMVGTDNIAVVSFTKKLLVQNAGDLMRYMFYRWRVRTSPYVFAGIYWIHRPYYMDDIPLEGLRKIRNGIDTYMTERMLELGRHRIVTLKEIGVDCMDYQNEDYPWRQFQDGIWYCANADTFQQIRMQRKLRDMSSRQNIMSRILDSHPALFVITKSVVYQYPWLYRGWLWAKRNPSHMAARAARGTPLSEWGMSGSKYVQDIRDWSKVGRTSTGFD